MSNPLTLAQTATPPRHVAIILDGNGRWARSRGLPRIAGHRQGVEAVRRTITGAMELGISFLTLYCFSNENWKRPQSEINDLMALMRLYLRQEIDELDRNGVRVRFIGERRFLDPEIVQLVEESENRTRFNARFNLVVALSYGGRQEITSVVKHLAKKAAAGQIDPTMIDEQIVAANLFTSEMPDPELIIRTSGEKRISNFLLWQSAYAELVFTDVLWPDFCKEDLKRSIVEYGRRERRYGAIPA